MGALGCLIFVVFLIGMLAVMFACLALFIEVLTDTKLGNAIIRRFNRGD